MLGGGLLVLWLIVYTFDAARDAQQGSKHLRDENRKLLAQNEELLKNSVDRDKKIESLLTQMQLLREQLTSLGATPVVTEQETQNAANGRSGAPGPRGPQGPPGTASPSPPPSPSPMPSPMPTPAPSTSTTTSTSSTTTTTTRCIGIPLICL